MLKIKDNVDLKELEKYKIYPVYECSPMTGEVRIKELNKSYFSLKKLHFVKIKKTFARNFSKEDGDYFLMLSEHANEMIDLNILYDLIKAGLVEKVEE